MKLGRSSSAPADPVALVAQVNQGRVPALLKRKFDAMASDPFVFLRASAGLGHRSVDLSALPRVPVGWICGDLHLQNFGSFRGANRLVYFDLNDFDEAARLPVCLDLLRLLGSVLTGAPAIGIGKPQALSGARLALGAYAAALARGKAYWLERETATGPISALLKQTGSRKRRDLLASRTHRSGRARRITVDGTRYLAVAEDDPVRGQIASALQQLARRYGDEKFFELRDIAFRVAGMGSLGVHRYVALVAGKGDPDRNALIDFKHAMPSAAIGAFPRYAQPEWPGDAGRVVGVQDLCQAASPAYLCALTLGKLPFVVRELQPVEDKIALAPLGRALERLDGTLGSMARLAAYAQLRAASRIGAAGADELIEFGRELAARPAPWIDAARAVHAANAKAFAIFREAWRDGDPRLLSLTRQSPAQARKAAAKGRDAKPGGSAGRARGTKAARRAAPRKKIARARGAQRNVRIGSNA